MSYFDNVASVMFGGKAVARIEIGGRKVWELSSGPSYKNWVTYSLESGGASIYNGGIGYKDGYRVRSGGAEAAMSEATCTGYIPVSAGDVIRVAGVDFGQKRSSNSMTIFDSSFAVLGQMAGNTTAGYGTLAGTSYGSNTSVTEEKDGVWKWVVPPESYGVTAYVRVTGYTNGASGSNLIVTVNEEIA